MNGCGARSPQSQTLFSNPAAWALGFGWTSGASLTPWPPNVGNSRRASHTASTLLLELADNYEHRARAQSRRCIAMPATDSLFADALTQGQIDCLLLVSNHFTSKEIASRL